MKPAEIKRIVKEARDEGELSVARLDAILEEPESFDKNVDRLIKELGELPVETAPSGDDKIVANDIVSKSRVQRNANEKHNRLFDYLKEINSHRRMKRDDEVRLSRRLEFFKRRLLWIAKNKTLPTKIRKILKSLDGCSAASERGMMAPICSELGDCPKGISGFLKNCCSSYNALRTEFVERNLGLVVSLAMPYRTYGIPLMDLIQEGNMVLIRAVEKFDWRKGVRFQTYATFWIRQAVERFIGANNSIVRVPNYLQQKMRRFKREGLLPKDGAALTANDVSKNFRVSSKVAGRLLETSRKHISLDSPLKENESGSLSDLVAEEQEESLSDNEQHKLKSRIKEALGNLSNEERFILQHRFGLEGKKTKTLEEIGKLLKVSRERIRQLQNGAIRKLKKPSLEQRLVPFLV